MHIESEPRPVTTNPKNIDKTARPSVFEFTNYREFLSSFYKYKKSTQPSYSMSVFARMAGLGANSRGYLKMIVDGKRNLTPHTVRRFADALGLKAQEGLHFENLVYFNQAKNSEDRDYYFARLNSNSRSRDNPKFKMLRNHMNYYTRWYYVAIRELVALKDFEENPKWIVAKLRNKITETEATSTIQELIELGFLKRGEGGKLAQSNALLGWKTDFYNQMVTQFQLEMIDRARESIQNDSFKNRDASSVTISCRSNLMPLIINRVDSFRDQLVKEFGADDPIADSVIQINLQSFFLTPQPVIDDTLRSSKQ
jgi:uncharacterized protein (TIGR02147 family)